jgi:hypothetical protein
MTPECQAAVNALMITGMDQAEAEKIILDLHAALPAATGIELTLMALEALKKPQPAPVQPAYPLNLESELRELSHVYGAGTFGQQVKQQLRQSAAGIVTGAFWLFVIYIVVPVTAVLIFLAAASILNH